MTLLSVARNGPEVPVDAAAAAYNDGGDLWPNGSARVVKNNCPLALKRKISFSSSSRQRDGDEGDMLHCTRFSFTHQCTNHKKSHLPRMTECVCLSGQMMEQEIPAAIHLFHSNCTNTLDNGLQCKGMNPNPAKKGLIWEEFGWIVQRCHLNDML